MKIIIYLFFLVVLLIASLSFREGFEGGQYAYLAPSPPAVLDTTTEATFITTFNATGGVIFPNAKIDPFDTKKMTDFKKYVTLDEFNYYIQNKKWPYNSYIMNYLNANQATVTDVLQKLKIYSIENLQKILPTRFVYIIFMNPKESTMSPKPLSNDIFTGQKPPPVEAPTPSSAAKIADTISAKPTIHPPFSSDNYTKLQSICSTLT